MAVDVQLVIEGAVHAAPPSVAIEKVETTFGHDHNDEEAWFVTVEVPPSTEQLGGDRLLKTMVRVNDALLAADERRFACVLFRYLGEENAGEGDPARATDS